MSLDDLLASLRLDYIAQLPKKIDIIEGQIRNKAHDDLRESFHKLKGTGKTYGLPEVSVLAEVVEDLFLSSTPENGLHGAIQGAAMLKEIHAARAAGSELDVGEDARLSSLRKLLP